MRALDFRAYGTPKPQGSKKIVHIQGHARMMDASKGIGEWRNSVIDYALKAKDDDFERFEGPVYVAALFFMPRPKKYMTKKWLGFKKVWHTTTPDIDKIIRSTFDGITLAGIWRDDSQVSILYTEKFYTPDSEPIGVDVTITELENK